MIHNQGITPLGKTMIKSDFFDNQSHSNYSSYNMMSPLEKINIEKFYQDLSKELK
jgi:hypothetical protein